MPDTERILYIQNGWHHCKFSTSTLSDIANWNYVALNKCWRTFTFEQHSTKDSFILHWIHGTRGVDQPSTHGQLLNTSLQDTTLNTDGRIDIHDDIITWKLFPCYWPFVRGIHRWPVDSPQKGPVMWSSGIFFAVNPLLNNWTNSGVVSDLRCLTAHVDGLVQERRNSIANALELRLSCTNPTMWHHCYASHFQMSAIEAPQ